MDKRVIDFFDDFIRYFNVQNKDNPITRKINWIDVTMSPVDNTGKFTMTIFNIVKMYKPSEIIYITDNIEKYFKLLEITVKITISEYNIEIVGYI